MNDNPTGEKEWKEEFYLICAARRVPIDSYIILFIEALLQREYYRAKYDALQSLHPEDKEPK